MPILGFSGHLPLLPIAGGSSREYDFLRNWHYPLNITNTTIAYNPFNDAFQHYGDENTQKSENKMIGNQRIDRFVAEVISNTHTGTGIIMLRHSEDAVSFSDLLELTEILTLVTGTLETSTGLPLTMNDNEYYNLKQNAVSGAGQILISTHALIQVL